MKFWAKNFFSVQNLILVAELGNARKLRNTVDEWNTNDCCCALWKGSQFPDAPFVRGLIFVQGSSSRYFKSLTWRTSTILNLANLCTVWPKGHGGCRDEREKNSETCCFFKKILTDWKSEKHNFTVFHTSRVQWQPISDFAWSRAQACTWTWLYGNPQLVLFLLRKDSYHVKTLSWSHLEGDWLFCFCSLGPLPLCTCSMNTISFSAYIAFAPPL